jgi:hypothetical protein
MRKETLKQLQEVVGNAHIVIRDNFLSKTPKA